MDYKTLEIIQKNPNSPVFHLFLNNRSLRNALSRDFFIEFPKAISTLDTNPNVSVIILSGHGDHFCSGIDIKTLNSASNSQSNDRGRIGEHLRREIKGFQTAISALEQCRKPVIAAIHGGCIGGGIDLVTACDIRYCTEDSFFSVKEVDLGITADLGTLQRLPKIVGYGNAIELALTGRRFSGLEAKGLGLISRVFVSKESMYEGVRIVAEVQWSAKRGIYIHCVPISLDVMGYQTGPVSFSGTKLVRELWTNMAGIAGKSPLAVIGTKEVLLRSRDMSVDQGLDYVATWNSAMLLSDDLTEAIAAQIQKRKPVFAKL